MIDTNLLNGVQGHIESKQFKVTKPIVVTVYGLQNGDLLYIHRQASNGDFYRWYTGSKYHLSSSDMTYAIKIPGIYKVIGFSSSSVIIDYCLEQPEEYDMSLYGEYSCIRCGTKYREFHSDGVFVPSSPYCPACTKLHTSGAILNLQDIPGKVINMFHKPELSKGD